MKKRALAFVMCLFLIVAVAIVYIFSELYTESELEDPNKEPVITDAVKFKNEYEGLNGTIRKTDSGEYTIRTITIDEKNPFIMSDAKKVLDLIDKKENFIVYFGFNDCPWCRSVLPTAIESAKKNNIDKIYYVDVKNIRDVYTLDANHKAVRTTEGTEEYYKLLEKMDKVLSDYSPLTYTNKKKKTVKVKIDEKRIYAPNFVMFKNGEAVLLEEGISSKQTDGYQELTEDIVCEMKDKFNCFFENFEKKEETFTCSTENIC